MKKSSGKKRVSSLTFLIATTAVLAAVAVLCLFGSNLLYAMRVRNVNEQRAEVEKRNTERYEAYRQEVQELQDRLTANNNISADWPTPDTQEGISIVDLTNYPLDNPGTVTVSRQDVMLGGLLLVNEWHSRPSDFDESSLVSIMTYARSMGVTKSIWRNSDQRLFPVAANALLDALNAAKEAGLEGYVVRVAAEVVQACLAVVDIPAIAQGVRGAEGDGHGAVGGHGRAPGIVGVARDGAAAAVDYTDNVALRVEHIIVQRIIVLHRQRLVIRRVCNDRNKYS